MLVTVEAPYGHEVVVEGAGPGDLAGDRPGPDATGGEFEVYHETAPPGTRLVLPRPASGSREALTVSPNSTGRRQGEQGTCKETKRPGGGFWDGGVRGLSTPHSATGEASFLQDQRAPSQRGGSWMLERSDGGGEA